MFVVSYDQRVDFVQSRNPIALIGNPDQWFKLMELRQLRSFLVVAEEAHFRRAAERLHLAQATLSQQIQQLERDLGTPLFERFGRRIRLTAAGDLFRDHARRIVTAADEARLAINELEGLNRGRVAVGCVQTVDAYWVPPALARFLADYPAGSVRVEELAAERVEAGVLDGRLDLGLSFLPPRADGLISERLFDEELVLIVSNRHPLARRSPSRLRLAELAGQPLVLLPEGFCTRRLLDEHLTTVGVQPSVALEMNAIIGILATVEQSRLATVLPALSLGTAKAPKPSLQTIRLMEPTPTRTVGLLWRAGGYRSRAARALAAVIQTPETAPP